MNIKRGSVVGLMAATAFVFTSAEACNVRVNGDGNATVTPAPTTTPPVGEPPLVSFDGDAGLDSPFTVVAADDANELDEVQAGVYVTGGGVGDEPDENCNFVQTRPQEVTAPVDVVVESNDDAAADAVVPNEPVTATPGADFTVTLVAGDTFYTEGCQDWVLQTEDSATN